MKQKGEKLLVDGKTQYFFFRAWQTSSNEEWNYNIRLCILAFNTFHNNIVAITPKYKIRNTEVSVTYGDRGVYDCFVKHDFHKYFVEGIVSEDSRTMKFGFFKTMEEAEIFALKSGVMQGKLEHEKKELERLKKRCFAKMKEMNKTLQAIDRAKKLA